MLDRPHPSTLVDVLVRRGGNKTELTKAVQDFYSRCGEYLVAMGYVPLLELYEALAQQAAEAGDFEAAERHLRTRIDLAEDRTMTNLDDIRSAIAAIVAVVRPVGTSA